VGVWGCLKWEAKGVFGRRKRLATTRIAGLFQNCLKIALEIKEFCKKLAELKKTFLLELCYTVKTCLEGSGSVKTS